MFQGMSWSIRRLFICIFAESDTLLQEAWPIHKLQHKPCTDAWHFCIRRGAGRALYPPSFRWTGSLRPERIGPYRQIPDHISKPDYYLTGIPEAEIRSKQQHSVLSWGPEAISGIREACRIGRLVLDAAHATVKPGITTDEIDRVVHETTIGYGAYPSPYNYYNFPKSVCTSVNEVICHGIPDRRPLEEGDIVNIDVSVFYSGYHGDLNETCVVGETDEQSKQLVKTTHDCLHAAIELCRPGARYRDIGEVIHKKASAAGFSVVRAYCGHGIGEHFHCAPNVPHYAANKAKGIMKVGDVFTIEPMINVGSHRDQTWPDGWTAVTEDGRRSAQFEHQLLITEDGCEILTKRLPESPPLWWEL